MNKHTRRRFLTDLAFIGGGLLCAVGGAWVTQPSPAEAAPAPAPTPSPSPRPLLKGEPRPAVPGEMVAPPRPSPGKGK